MAEEGEAPVQITPLVDIYFELCSRYRRPPLAEATVALRFDAVTTLKLTPQTELADLLPLGEILKVDTTITTLDCSQCMLGDYACFILRETLSRNMTLRSLNLSHMGITDTGALALVDALTVNVSAEEVILRGNSIGAKGGEALANWVRHSPCVRFLDVSNNSLRLPGVHALYHALRARRRDRMLRDQHPRRGNGIPRLRSRRRGRSPRREGEEGGRGGEGQERTASPPPEDFVFEFEYDDQGGRVRAGSNGGRDRALSPDGSKPSRSEWWSAAAQSQSRADGVEVRWGGNMVQQEIANSIIHGIGLVLSVLGAFGLLSHVRQSGDAAYMTGAVAYLAGLIVFYLAATLRHSLFFLEGPSRVMQVIDHSAVFVLIAGTYTPFALVNFEAGPPTARLLGRAILVTAWASAALGVYISTACSRRRCRRVKMFLYISMGWLGFLPAAWGYQCFAPRALVLLGVGGVIYTLGALMYLRQRLDPRMAQYNGFWYGLVLVASVMHFVAVLTHVERRAECGVATDKTLWEHLQLGMVST